MQNTSMAIAPSMSGFSSGTFRNTSFTAAVAACVLTAGWMAVSITRAAAARAQEKSMVAGRDVEIRHDYVTTASGLSELRLRVREHGGRTIKLSLLPDAAGEGPALLNSFNAARQIAVGHADFQPRSAAGDVAITINYAPANWGFASSELRISLGDTKAVQVRISQFVLPW